MMPASARFKTRSLLVMPLLLSLALVLSGHAQPASGIVEPKKTYSYLMSVRDMKKLAAAYPELIRYSVVGESAYGRKLYAMEVGRGPVNVLLNGSHHAREWISTSLLMKLAEAMAVADAAGRKLPAYRTDARELLDHVTFHIVPMVNPDGVTLQQQGVKAFPPEDRERLIALNGGSDNFRRWKADALGVDLNRQYPAGWDNIRNARPEPGYMNHKGAAPLAAKEAAAMAVLAEELLPQLAVSYHSSGEYVYWNYRTPPEHVERDRKLAQEYGKITGYRLVRPEPNPSGGGFTDWFIQRFGKPALTPELGKPAGETNVALSQWDRIWRQHRDTVWLFAARALELSVAELRPSAASGAVKLSAPTNGYKWPILNAAQAAPLPAGLYRTTRGKGSWIELATDAGPRWVAKSRTTPV